MTYPRLMAILGATVIAGTLVSNPNLAVADDGIQEPETQYGVGIRLRQLILPRSVIELFVEHAPGGIQENGIGIELIRQRGNMTFSFGAEYDRLNGTDGIYIDKGDAIPQDPVDYVRFDDFHWLAFDVNFLWQTNLIGEILSLRYGAGLGIGILRGQILQSDYLCPGTQPDNTCFEDPAGVQNAPADLPPVFPVVNALLGLQLRPIKSVAITIEGGLRTAPFFGSTVAVMF